MEHEDRLAKKIAKELLALIYQEVGAFAVKKFLWLSVAVVIGLAVWLGIIHIPKIGG